MICGGVRGSGAGFSPNILVSPPSHHSTNAPYAYIINIIRGLVQWAHCWPQSQGFSLPSHSCKKAMQLPVACLPVAEKSCGLDNSIFWCLLNILWRQHENITRYSIDYAYTDVRMLQVICYDCKIVSCNWVPVMIWRDSGRMQVE